jgi:hypothetical protein
MGRARKDDLDDGNAFLPDPRSGERPVRRDTLAELVVDSFLSAATTGGEAFDDARNAVTADELGGPFIEVDGSEELADGPDASNPEDATKEPFPTPNRLPRE